MKRVDCPNCFGKGRVVVLTEWMWCDGCGGLKRNDARAKWMLPAMFADGVERYRAEVLREQAKRRYRWKRRRVK